MSEKIEQLKNFIFNDEVQDKLSKINNNLMDFNILEITGMGHQETKHSNILGWLFDNSEHNLKYLILENFLKKVIEENTISEELKKYIYLSVKKDLKIYREKDNIDLLIIDEQNKVLIIIENKVFSNERTEGKDGGQLKKYEDKINSKYLDKYTKFFIFLTIDLEESSRKNWLKANYQMITDTLKEIINTKEDLSIKTKLILESYIDLLKRRKIVEDEEIKGLCSEIWNNAKYKDALNILMEYKPNKLDEIYEYIKNYYKKDITKPELKNNTYKFEFEFDTNLRYIILYRPRVKLLGIFVLSESKIEETKKASLENCIRNELEGTIKFNINSSAYRMNKVTEYINLCEEDDEKLEEKIQRIIEIFNKIDNCYNILH
jgi:hypothetical protein